MKKTFIEIQLERIANALEAIAFPVKEEKPQEQPQKEEVEELAKEEHLEAPEAEKATKEEPLIKKEEAEKFPEDTRAMVVGLKEFIEIIKDKPEIEKAPKEEPKVEPVKKAVLKHKKEVKRINPYRLKEEPKKGPVSGFRIKE